MIPTIKPSNDRATVQGKLNKLVYAKVSLRSNFLSLISQKKDVNVIKLLNAVELTKSNEQRQ